MLLDVVSSSLILYATEIIIKDWYQFTVITPYRSSSSVFMTNNTPSGALSSQHDQSCTPETTLLASVESEVITPL